MLDAPGGQDDDVGAWHDQLSTTHAILEQQLHEEQARIRQAAESQPTALQVGQLVLMRRTPAEVQQAHTKLTDKYDHPARVVRILPSRVVYRVVVLATGEEMDVNQRNLRRFYAIDVDEEDPALQGPRLPVAPVEGS